MLLVAVATALYGVWVYSSARAVENMLDRAESLDVSGIAAGDDGALLAAQRLVDESNDATDSLSARLGPLRVAEAVLGWVPWAGDQLDAPDLLLDRAEAALYSTEPLIGAAEDLFMLRQSIGGGDSSGDDDQFDELVRSLEQNASEASLRMERVTEASNAMDGLSLLGIFDKRARRVTSLENKLLRFGDVLAESPAAISDARRVVTAGSNVANLLDGSKSDLDLQKLAAAMTELAGAAQSATGSASRLEELAVAAAPGTGLADFASTVSQSVAAISDLSTGLATIIVIFGQSAEVLGRSDGSLLSNGDDLQAALRPLVLQREQLKEAVDLTAAGLERFGAVVSSGKADFLPAGLTNALVDRTDSVLAAAGLMLDGPELLLSLTGADSPKKYLVLGQTSDELRAAGGFTSSAWTLSFENGALTETDFIPILLFEDRQILSEAGPPPAPLSYYMNTGALYLRDVGWDPDFTSVGKLATDLYRLHRGGEIDGVISVTQWGIIRLVEAIGGIEIDGELISPEETLSVIEQGTDTEGTIFLEQLFTRLLDSFNGDVFADPEFKLFKALNEIISQKDVMIFSVHEGEQDLIETLGLAGTFPVDSRDRIGVVDSNVGWSKSDRSIERSVGYTLDLSEPSRPTAELTLSYRNAGTEIGRDCSSQRTPQNLEAIYSVSLNSCYWNYFRAYVATGADVTASPLLPLPVNSVPDQQDRQAAGTSTFLHGFDAFGDYLAGLVTVAPGESIKFSFEYDLPATVLNPTSSGFMYELALVAQSGARGRATAVELQLPAGYSLGQTSHAPEFQNDGTVRFLFDLVSDQVLLVELIADS